MTSIAIDRTDGLSSSTAIKGPCRVTTTANISLTGEQTIDGIAVVTDDRVLVKDQTTESENGIYVVDTGPWRRARDFYGNRDVRKGTQVLVTSGTLSASSVWLVSTADPITIGTSSITFAQIDGQSGFRFLQRVIISASGNYTPHVNCDAIDVQCIGGGAGGGATAATGASEAAAGSGGGAGGYARKFYNQAAKEALVFPLAVTVGAGGAGGISGSSEAVAGGSTTFSGITASGGVAGLNATTGSTNAALNGGAGGAATGGDTNSRGGGGGSSVRLATVPLAGGGGLSFFMGGARGATTTTGFAGTAGSGPGSGGSGASAGASQSAFAGGAGADGVIIIDEYAVE